MKVFKSDFSIEIKSNNSKESFTIPLSQTICSCTEDDLSIEPLAALFNKPNAQLSTGSSQILFNSSTKVQSIMEDKRFHSKRPKRSDLLQEQSMLTTISLDDQTKLDFFVKLKTFNTRTDGKYNLLALFEVCVQSKLVTGNYILLKIKEVKNKQEETSKK